MAARQWTEEQRKAQAEKIKTYQPWLQSTGPTSEQGKKIISQNALKTGEYTADKVAERKRKAKVKKSCGWGCSYGDKRFRWNRSINYCGFMKTTKKAEREKAKERIKAALKD